MSSKNNRSIDTPVKGPPQGPRLHIDIPRVQLLIEDKEGIKQIGKSRHFWIIKWTMLSCYFPARLSNYFMYTRVCDRRGQGSGAGDRHRVQPIGESSELLHRSVSAPPSPHPELRASDWHVRHPPWHKWACFILYVQMSDNGLLSGWVFKSFFIQSWSLISGLSLRPCVKEEHKIRSQLQEQILQPVDAEST